VWVGVFCCWGGGGIEGLEFRLKSGHLAVELNSECGM
jgi:hypothetical protein